MATTKDLVKELCKELDSIIEIEGEVTPGNKKLWKWLHSFDNNIWKGIFDYLLTQIKDNPEHVKEYQKKAVMEARTKFLTSTSKSKNIMDTKDFKKYSWQMMMNMRELNEQCPEQLNLFTEPAEPIAEPALEPKTFNPKVTTAYFNDRTVVTIYH